MRVKICGLTRVDDALAAEAAGADAVGFIFAERSRRRVSPVQAERMSAALGPLIARIGVFVDAPLAEVQRLARELKLSAVQLHGAEDADYAAALREQLRVIRAVRFSPELSVSELRAYPADAVLLDGLEPGSGSRFDWSAASNWFGFPRLVLAGGLTPENVEAAISALAPYAVDVASGVEQSPGVKDTDKIRAFVRRAKSAQLSTVIHRLS